MVQAAEYYRLKYNQKKLYWQNSLQFGMLRLMIELHLEYEEGDYVMQNQPCSFLGADNYCSIYEVRPSDCERFPYTDEDVILKRPNITLKNSSFCPAVYYVLEKLMEGKK